MESLASQQNWPTSRGQKDWCNRPTRDQADMGVKNIIIIDYTIIHKNREKRKGGGLMVPVHENILLQEMDSLKCDGTLEVQAIKINGKQEILIINFLLELFSSCSVNFDVEWKQILHHDLIVSDGNAHDSLRDKSSKRIGSDLASIPENESFRSPQRSASSPPVKNHFHPLLSFTPC